jgi:hypothetical protein
MAQSRETDVEKTMKRKEKYGGMTRAMYLENYAVMGMLPTPTVRQVEDDPKIWDARMERMKEKGYGSFSMPLTQMAMRGMLPTPTVSDKNGSGSKESLQKRGRGETNDLSSWATMNTNGKNSQLNPRFVAEMMGFPPNWTELPFLNGEENQSKDTEMQ